MKNFLLLPCALFLLIVSCSKDFEDLDELSETLESKNFIYHYSPLDTTPIDTVFQEQYIAWLLKKLDCSNHHKINFYKYLNRKHLQRITSRDVNAFAESNKHRLHTIWPIDNHECVHILINNTFGFPPSLFDEGIAVAHQATLENGMFVPGWNGRDFHLICQELLQEYKLPELDQILENKGFRSIQTAVSYPLSGSFCTFLIENHGWQRFSTFISTIHYKDDKERIKKDYSKTLHTTIEADWKKWKKMIFHHEYIFSGVGLKKILIFVRNFTNRAVLEKAITDKQKRTARYAKAMGHPVRMHVLELLSNQSCCYSGDLSDELPIAKSTLSQHLKELKEAGLIQGEIEAPRIKYCINKENWKEAQILFKQFLGI